MTLEQAFVEAKRERKKFKRKMFRDMRKKAVKFVWGN